jgi:two-component system CheB/CheR fusion protein
MSKSKHPSNKTSAQAGENSGTNRTESDEKIDGNHNNDQMIYVGIGYSPEDLDGLKSLVSCLPSGKGMVYIAVPNIDTEDHDSLFSILSSLSCLPVENLQKSIALEPDTLYIVPSRQKVSVTGGYVQLSNMSTKDSLSSTDHLFISIAGEKGPLSVGIILSRPGRGGDQGVLAIKSHGGITIGQVMTGNHPATDPENVDLFLPVGEIGPALESVHEYVHSVSEDSDGEKYLGYVNDILDLIEKREKIDMKGYKFNTIFRRISRRVVLLKKNTDRKSVV